MIPWLSSTFRGFVVGLWHGHTLYRFATYTGARIEKLEIADQQVEWTIRNRTARLKIHARRTHGGVLRGPTVADMGVRVPETLLGQVTARLSRFDGQREAILFEGTGRNAGIEVVGDVDRLLKG
jgi:hypothetical protein